MIIAHRLLLKWARTLHVYLTLFGFALLFFFALTGFMLNHEKWFVAEESFERRVGGVLPMSILGENPDPLAIVEKLRKDFDARGEADYDDNKENDAIRVTFKAPGYLGTAVITREDGTVEVTHRNDGIMSLLLELHRGKSTGSVWSIVIDFVSILFILVAITGLILWSSLRGRAQHGILVLMLGLSLSLVVYFVWVPR